MKQVAARLTVSPEEIPFSALGDTARLTARVFDALGSPVEGVAVSWASSDASVATVDPAGLVTAAGPGEAEVTASVAEASAAARVRVVPMIGSLTVSPSRVILLRDDPVPTRLLATVQDEGGTEMVAPVTWTTSNRNSVTVDSTGLLGWAAAGDVTITASVVAAEGDTIRASAAVLSRILSRLEIQPDRFAYRDVGDTVRFVAAAYDSATNAAIPDPPFVWSSGDSTVATVDQAGFTMVVSAGETFIRVRLGPRERLASVVRHRAPPPPKNSAPTIEKQLLPLTVSIGQTATLVLGEYFSDPDGDSLIYKATASATDLIDLRVSRDTLFVSGKATGSESVKVTASDPEPLEISQSMRVTVQPAPSFSITRSTPNSRLHEGREIVFQIKSDPAPVEDQLLQLQFHSHDNRRDLEYDGEGTRFPVEERGTLLIRDFPFPAATETKELTVQIIQDDVPEPVWDTTIVYVRTESDPPLIADTVVVREGTCDRSVRMQRALHLAATVTGRNPCRRMTPEKMHKLSKIRLLGTSGLATQFNAMPLIKGDFLDLPNLHTLLLLSLDFTNAKWSEEVFSDAPTLRDVTLRGDFGHLPAETFAGLDNLTNLDLQFRHLDSISVDLLTPPSNLEVLRLQGMTRGPGTPTPVALDPELFDPVKETLRIFDLTGLGLAAGSLRAGMFSNLNGLTELYLDSALTNNPVLPDGLFQGLQNLRTIDMGHNFLTDMAGAFSEEEYPALEILNMEFNDLTEASFPAGWLSKFTVLRRLQLSLNQIRRFPDGFFTGVRHLIEILLVGNPRNFYFPVLGGAARLRAGFLAYGVSPADRCRSVCSGPGGDRS
ncbi:Ig-like domain-containing protein [Candidatus Palauibacter sp.]|uniref:Ig-like domain-containing protein n=1 Tax=Candidatus Palauibacter sp. TaxID=3101350 RepID=UPI003AF2010E